MADVLPYKLIIKKNNKFFSLTAKLNEKKEKEKKS